MKLTTALEHDDPLRRADVNTLARGVTIGFIGRASGRLLNMLSQVAVARLLDPGAFGLYSIAWNLLNLSGQLVALGLPTGVIRFAPRYRSADKPAFRSLLLKSIGWAALSGIAIGAALFLAATPLSALFNKPELAPLLRIVALAFPLGAIMLTVSAATRISQRIQFSVTTEDIIQPVVDLGLILLIYIIGGRLWGFMVSGVISYGCAAIYAIYALGRLFPEIFDRRLGRTTHPSSWELLRFSLPTAAAGMFAVLVIRIDRLIVAYFLPASDVGVYQAASQFSIIFAMIISAVGVIFGPMAADLFHRQQADRLQEVFRVSTKWMLYLSIPPFLVTAFAPREVMVVLFGAPYAAGATPLLILSLARLAHAASGSGNDLLVMAGKQNQWFAISSAMLVLNVALSLWLVPRLGLSGAALATLCAMSGMFILLLWLIRRLLGVWPYDRRYLKGLAAALAAALALLFLTQVPTGSGLAHLALLTLTATLVFGASLWLFGLDAEDQVFIDLLRARWRR